MGSEWRFDEVGGLRLLRSEALARVPGIAHAFGTRQAEGASAATFFRAAGLGSARPLLLRQVHGAEIVDAEPWIAVPAEGDGAYRSGGAGPASPCPSVVTADCVAILLAHREAKSVAAVHAGWRGAAAGIGTRAVSRFSADGLESRDIVAALGPAILGCCYAVGDEVVSALASSCGPLSGFVAVGAAGQRTVDLHLALTAQLIRAGLPKESIHRAPFCTRCRNDLFFSYRAEGRAAGRMMAAVGPATGP